MIRTLNRSDPLNSLAFRKLSVSGTPAAERQTRLKAGALCAGAHARTQLGAHARSLFCGPHTMSASRGAHLQRCQWEDISPWGQHLGGLHCFSNSGCCLESVKADFLWRPHVLASVNRAHGSSRPLSTPRTAARCWVGAAGAVLAREGGTLGSQGSRGGGKRVDLELWAWVDRGGQPGALQEGPVGGQ